jgi:hypothetical protein
MFCNLPGSLLYLWVGQYSWWRSAVHKMNFDIVRMYWILTMNPKNLWILKTMNPMKTIKPNLVLFPEEITTNTKHIIYPGMATKTFSYIYIHIYIHTYIYTHIHTYIHIYIHTHCKLKRAETTPKIGPKRWPQNISFLGVKMAPITMRSLRGDLALPV